MTKQHREPAIMVNICDVTMYADGVKLTFGESPDGAERNSDHRGSFFMTYDVLENISNALQRVMLIRNPKNAAAHAREEFRQSADTKPELDDFSEERLRTPT